MIVQLGRRREHLELERRPELDGGRDEGRGRGGGDGGGDEAGVEAALEEFFCFFLCFSLSARQFYLSLVRVQTRNKRKKEEEEAKSEKGKKLPNSFAHPDERPKNCPKRRGRGLRHAEDGEVALEAVGDVVLAVARRLHRGDVTVIFRWEKKREKEERVRGERERERGERKSQWVFVGRARKKNSKKKETSPPLSTTNLPRVDNAAHVPDRLLQRVHPTDLRQLPHGLGSDLVPPLVQGGSPEVVER